jgi:hypothetical protein
MILVVVCVAAAGCGERLLTPVHPEVVTDWRCSDINTTKHPCPTLETVIVGVGELVDLSATWEGVCLDSADRYFKHSPYPKGCRERPFTMTVRCEPACRLEGHHPIFDATGPAVVIVTLVPPKGKPFVQRIRLSVVDPDRGSIAVTCQDDDRHHAVSCRAATAAWFCVTARADQRVYVVMDVGVGGDVQTDVHVRPGQIDLPSRPACRPVPLGASLDISVGAEHHLEVFGPEASPGYYR